MKQMTCSAMGGTCDTMIMGNTAEEMSTNGMTHVMSAHPEMADKIKAMTKEETEKWMADFTAKFNALPDMPAA